MSAGASALSRPAEDTHDPFAGGVVERVLGTSAVQREVWLADGLGTPASLAFNESVCLRLRGVLDTVALGAAYAGLLRRHVSLRATLDADGAAMLITADATAERAAALPLVDLRTEPAGAREAALAAAAADAVQRPFVLTEGPLLRATLYRLDEAEHVLLMTAHHIVCDGWSWGVLAEDLGALYGEQIGAAPAPEAADDYADYVQWESDELSGAALVAHERYWLARFQGGSLPVLDLPLDRPRPVQRSFASRRVDHVLEARLVEALQKAGSRLGSSLFGALFGGFAALLHRLTGQDDLVIGVPAAGQSASGLQRLVGHCVNLLPVRVAVDARQPFDAFVHHAGGLVLDAFEHQALGYGALLARLPVRRDPGRLPLMSVMFNVDPSVKRPEALMPGLWAELSGNARCSENFELFLNAVRLVDGSMRLECQYSTALFDERTVQRWLGSYEALLAGVVADIGLPLARLPMLAATEQAALRALQPAPTPLPAPALMHAAIDAQCRATPQRQALRGGSQVLSYVELDRRANRLAHWLRAHGVRRGDRVGLCLPRGVDMVVALLGVLRSGAAYVPLDPGFPVSRLAFYAEDAALALLVTQSDVASAPSQWRADASSRTLYLDTDPAWLAADAAPLSPGPDDAGPEDVAYVIYTSGSTGQPKGVCLPHRAVANFLASMQQQPGLRPDDRLAAVTTLSFDIAVLELLLPLQVGAQTVIVPRETVMDGAALKALLLASQANVMQATPGLWRMLLEAGWRGAAGFKALVGGEALPPDLAHELLARAGEVWNLYGPTETTVWSTAWRVDGATLEAAGVAIGTPIANTTVWIVDAEGQLCPRGVPGEICIGGHGVALGYLGREALTAERFVADPHAATAGARMYRTGDRGRWRNDGLLEHLGRLDFQVKVRGYRIELGEIEAACVAWPGVTQAVVLAREDHPGDVRLVAYLVPGADGAIDEAGLREHLHLRLPDYMLPQHLVTLAALPRLPNGKTDRKVLPPPAAGTTPATSARTPPRNELEGRILGAMESVLKLPGLSVDDDFFALGGHSLLAARLVTRLNAEQDLGLKLHMLFKAPTAARLAQALNGPISGVPALQPVHDAGRDRAPLTPMQERVRFMAELYPESAAYNTPSAHALNGPMDVAAFQRAFTAMVQRQSALRTQVVGLGDGRFEQQVVPVPAPTLPLIDLSAEPGQLRSAMDTLAARPIDLHSAPLFHAALYRLAPDRHVFVFVPHHLVWDGWSFDVLYREMAALYTAESSGSPPTLQLPRLSHLDYAHAYAHWLQGGAAAAELAWWRQRYAAVAMPRSLPTDHPRRPGKSGAGAAEDLVIDAALTQALRARARTQGVTLGTYTMAVFAALLAGLARTPTLVLGVPVRGRDAPGLDDVMGYFNNLLPLPLVPVPDQPFTAFLQALRDELAQAMTHQQIPFEVLSAQPEILAKSSPAGLYQAAYSYQDVRERSSAWGALSHERLPLFQNGVTEELGLWLAEMPDRLIGAVTFNLEVYSPSTARALHLWFVEVLQRTVVDDAQTLATLTLPAQSAAALHLQNVGQGTTASTAAPSAPVVAAPLAPGKTAAPLRPAEAALAEVWAELLNLEVGLVRASDNFFDLGGDSIMAMRAVEAAAQRLGVRVGGRRYIYETLAQIAATDPEGPDREAPVAAPASAPHASGGLVGRMLSVFGRKNAS